MPTWKQPFPQNKPFKCCAAWHLHKSGQILAIYDFVGGLTNGGQKTFFSSIQKVATFFGMNYESVRRSFKVLRKMGFFGLRDGNPYYVSHDDWAATHPGMCAQREMFPWQDCSDPFIGQIWSIAGGKIRVVDWQIAAIRKYIGEAVFLEEFKIEMASANLKRVPGGDWSGTSPKSVFWNVFRRLKDDASSFSTVEAHAPK
jgi:hypothetical protein